MSADQYPQVVEDLTVPVSYRVWSEAHPQIGGRWKVVPADAIVIEPQDFGDTQAQSIAANALGYVPRTPEEIARLHEHVIYLASALARLHAHPPVDEAQVEALTADLLEVFAADGGCQDGWSAVAIARSLVRRGVTKPVQP